MPNELCKCGLPLHFITDEHKVGWCDKCNQFSTPVQPQEPMVRCPKWRDCDVADEACPHRKLHKKTDSCKYVCTRQIGNSQANACLYEPVPAPKGVKVHEGMKLVIDKSPLVMCGNDGCQTDCFHIAGHTQSVCEKYHKDCATCKPYKPVPAPKETEYKNWDDYNKDHPLPVSPELVAPKEVCKNCHQPKDKHYADGYCSQYGIENKQFERAKWVGAEFIDTPEGVVCDEKYHIVDANKKVSEPCDNCGHDKSCHDEMGCRLLPTRQYCSCKKFETLTAEQQEKEVQDIYKDLELEPASIPKPETTATQFEIDVLTHIQHEALQAQGDWAGIDEEYAPEWTHGYKLIYNELANLIDWLEAKS